MTVSKCIHWSADAFHPQLGFFMAAVLHKIKLQPRLHVDPHPWPGECWKSTLSTATFMRRSGVFKFTQQGTSERDACVSTLHPLSCAQPHHQQETVSGGCLFAADVALVFWNTTVILLPPPSSTKPRSYAE